MKSRKALSEMIASMVILVIVSVLGIMLYNLSISTMNTQQENLLFDIGMEEGIALERFEIVGVTRTRSNEMNITYFNYGEVDIRITDVYLGSVRYPIPLINRTLCHNLEIKSWKFPPKNFELQNERILYEVRIVSERGVATDASVYL